MSTRPSLGLPKCGICRITIILPIGFAGAFRDDEARIGPVASILWRLHLIAALMNEHAWRDLTHFKR